MPRQPGYGLATNWNRVPGTGAKPTGRPPCPVAARALLGLWRVQGDSLRRHLHGSPAPAQLHELVTADVRRAAQLIDTGLHSFAGGQTGSNAAAGSGGW